MEQADFLEQKIFIDLKNVNDGFDKKEIKHFSEWDFEVLLQRAEHFGLGIYTIECWHDGQVVDIANHEDFNKKATDPLWYKKAFLTFKTRQSGLSFCGTYKVSPKLLARKNFQ